MVLDSYEQMTRQWRHLYILLLFYMIAEICTLGWKTSWSVTRTATVPQFGLPGPKVYVKWGAYEMSTMFAGEQRFRCISQPLIWFKTIRLSGQPNTSQHLLHAFNFNVWRFSFLVLSCTIFGSFRRAKGEGYSRSQMHRDFWGDKLDFLQVVQVFWENHNKPCHQTITLSWNSSDMFSDLVPLLRI